MGSGYGVVGLRPAPCPQLFTTLPYRSPLSSELVHIRLPELESDPGVQVKQLTTFDRPRALGGAPREQKMLKGHLYRVMYHQVY